MKHLHWVKIIFPAFCPALCLSVGGASGWELVARLRPAEGSPRAAGCTAPGCPKGRGREDGAGGARSRVTPGRLEWRQRRALRGRRAQGLTDPGAGQLPALRLDAPFPVCFPLVTLVRGEPLTRVTQSYEMLMFQSEHMLQGRDEQIWTWRQC